MSTRGCVVRSSCSGGRWGDETARNTIWLGYPFPDDSWSMEFHVESMPGRVDFKTRELMLRVAIGERCPSRSSKRDEPFPSPPQRVDAHGNPSLPLTSVQHTAGGYAYVEPVHMRMSIQEHHSLGNVDEVEVRPNHPCAGGSATSWVVRLTTTALNPILPPTGRATAAQSLVGHAHDECLNEWSIMKAFCTMDTDGNGWISREELFEAIGHAVTMEEFEMIMTDFDLNHDGKLQYDEMAKAWASLGLTTSTVNGQIFDKKREQLQLLTGVVSDELPELLPPTAKGATFKPFKKEWIVVSDAGGNAGSTLRPGPGQKENSSGHRNAPYDMDGPTPWHPPIGSEFGYDFLKWKVVHGVEFAMKSAGNKQSTCTRGS